MGKNIKRGLVGHWLTGDGSYLDKSGFGNHGTPTGVEYARAEKGMAGRFNGSAELSRILVGEDSSLNFDGGSELTLACWLKVNEMEQSYPVFIGKTLSDYRLGYESTGRDFYFRILSSTGIATLDPVIPHDPFKWNFVAGRLKDGLMEVYFNGVWSSTTEVFTGTIDNTLTNDVFIGTYSNGTGFFNGDLFDCRIYNVGLTNKEIDSIYAYGLNASPITRTIN